MSAGGMTISLDGGAVDFALTADRRFASFLRPQVPSTYMYNTQKSLPPGSRKPLIIYPDGGNTFTPNSTTIRFPVKSLKFIDFSEASIKCNIAVSMSDASACHLTQGAWNIFSGYRIYQANRVVWQQYNKNLFRSYMYRCVQGSGVSDSLGSGCWGVDSVANRQAKASGAIYQFDLDISPLAYDLIPMDKSTDFVIELIFAPAGAVVVQDTASTATPSYTVTNPKLYVHQCSFHPIMADAINAVTPKMFAGTNTKTIEQIVAAGAGSTQVLITNRLQSGKRLIAISKNATDIANPLIPDQFFQGMQYQNVQSFQGKINGTPYPDQVIWTANDAVNGFTEGYLALFNALNRYEACTDLIERHSNGESALATVSNWNLLPSDFLNDGFGMALELKAYKIHDEDLFSRFDTTQPQATLEFDINYASGSPTVTQRVYIFFVHSGMIFQHPSGEMELIE